MASLTFHGHACFVIEGAGHRVIIDPFLTDNPAADIGPDALPRLDAVLLTHGHGDHLGDTVRLARRDDAVVVAAYELAVFCEAQGLRVHKMNVGGAHTFPFGTVKLVPALHTGSIEGDETGRYTTVPCGIVLTIDGQRVYHAGDTALTLDMQLLRDRVDVMLVPIGDNYTMGIEDAARAVDFVRPKVAVPMHFNTFPVITVEPDEFRRAVGNTARVAVLQPGQRLEL